MRPIVPPDVGSYSYAGTGYANPHAATAINGVTYVYDKNGNATSSGPWKYTWNYRDRLTQVATGTATTTYAYDSTNQRVRQWVPTVGTSTYPNRFFDRTTVPPKKCGFRSAFTGDQVGPVRTRVPSIRGTADRDNTTGVS